MFSFPRPRTIQNPTRRKRSPQRASSSQLSGALQKAKLLLSPSERTGGRATNAESIEFQYNPSELKFDYSIETKSEGRTRNGIRKISFSGPNPTTLSISNITFDTFESGTNVEEQYIKPLLEAVKFPSGQRGSFQRGSIRRPPIYILQWGKQRYLRCFVKKIDYKLTMFLPDGTPVRAVANLSLEEVTQIVAQKKN